MGDNTGGHAAVDQLPVCYSLDSYWTAFLYTFIVDHMRLAPDLAISEFYVTQGAGLPDTAFFTFYKIVTLFVVYCLTSHQQPKKHVSLVPFTPQKFTSPSYDH